MPNCWYTCLMNSVNKLFDSYTYKVVDYLGDLASYGTQADLRGLPKNTLERFMKCANYIAETLKETGVQNVEVTDKGYVYATIPPSGTNKKTPVIALAVHYDTALENPGNGTKILTHMNYQGGDIRLPKGNITIPASELKDKKGHDIITGRGDNQMGADDKAGAAAAMDLARFLISNSGVEHGEIKLLFTNNEEVGRGVEHLDYRKLGADYAYCVDEGEVGNIFEENFNAEAVSLAIEGLTVHPGYAKDKMVNALLVANELINTLSDKFKSPEESQKREPYLGLNNIEGNWTKVNVHYLLRGFDEKDISKMKKGISDSKKKVLNKYAKATIIEKWDTVHTYKNAGKILKKYPKVNALAYKAYKSVGVRPIKSLVRGGFDGVRMSYQGLPTTNVFSGAMNMHGLNEWTTRQDLELTVRMLANLCHLWGREKK